MTVQWRTQLCFNYQAVSFLHLILFPVIFAVGMSPMAQAQSSIDRPKVAVDVVELNGTTHLPEATQEQLVASLKQREFEEDSDWVQDLENIVIRAETDGWPDRENQGYLGFSVSAQWKPLRREPGLLHVVVTVCVDEGQQKKLKAIEFRYIGDSLVRPVIDSDDLRKLISLNDGEIYNRDNYYAGLSAVSRAYSERGFIDCTVTNTMELDQVNQTVSLVMDINEGPQYRWRDIRVIGLDPKLETLLRSRLTPGSPVNPNLIRDFYKEYKSLLPVGASPETVKWESDAQRTVVDLTFDFSTPASQSVHD
jgi:outer membrane protein assembly factor BamA